MIRGGALDTMAGQHDMTGRMAAPFTQTQDQLYFSTISSKQLLSHSQSPLRLHLCFVHFCVKHLVFFCHEQPINND